MKRFAQSEVSDIGGTAAGVQGFPQSLKTREHGDSGGVLQGMWHHSDKRAQWRHHTEEEIA